VNAASRTSQNAVEGSRDEDSDSETSTKKKRASRRGRKKASTETLEGEREESQISSEQESPEETKKVKRRGRKKGKFIYWLHFWSSGALSFYMLQHHVFSLLYYSCYYCKLRGGDGQGKGAKEEGKKKS
jgi:hypothetical protein